MGNTPATHKSRPPVVSPPPPPPTKYIFPKEVLYPYKPHVLRTVHATVHAGAPVIQSLVMAMGVVAARRSQKEETTNSFQATIEGKMRQPTPAPAPD